MICQNCGDCSHEGSCIMKTNGPGRPKGSLNKKPNKKMLSVRIDPELMEWLKKQPSQTKTVEKGLRIQKLRIDYKRKPTT